MAIFSEHGNKYENSIVIADSSSSDPEYYDLTLGTEQKTYEVYIWFKSGENFNTDDNLQFIFLDNNDNLLNQQWGVHKSYGTTGATYSHEPANTSSDYMNPFDGITLQYTDGPAFVYLRVRADGNYSAFEGKGFAQTSTNNQFIVTDFCGDINVGSTNWPRKIRFYCKKRTDTTTTNYFSSLVAYSVPIGDTVI
jgi:hypothetical protein